MFKYVCKRIGLFLVSLFIIMTMLFVLIRMLPNPVVAVTGGYANQLEDMRRAWGYYDPIIVQYGIFLKNLFTGSIGASAPLWAPSCSRWRSTLPARFRRCCTSMCCR